MLEVFWDALRVGKVLHVLLLLLLQRGLQELNLRPIFRRPSFPGWPLLRQLTPPSPQQPPVQPRPLVLLHLVPCDRLEVRQQLVGTSGLILHGGNEGSCLHAPWSLPLVPLKCSRNLQFPHRVPFNMDKMPWCPCPFEKRSTQARHEWCNKYQNLFGKLKPRAWTFLSTYM